MDVCKNHSPLSSTRWPNVNRYEVFLSFRGGDVRRGFIEFLYEGLVDSGIYAFIDHDGIEIGEEIMPKILQVIRHTEICIPIFSKDFASSKSCLTEVTEMVGCNRTIMPIFYDVSPSVVGKHLGSYQQSFCNHAAEKVLSATIDKWKDALQKISGMLGWDLEKLKCGENELIRKVVSKVRQLLKKDDLDVTENLVGMGHHVQEMMKKLGVRCENGQVVEEQTLMGKRVVEISGLPGIGKSTLATIVFNRIHHLFEGKSFLKVEERRLLSLQEDLICDLQKRIYTPRSSAEGAKFIEYKFEDLRALIVIDDVSDLKQIHSLVIDPSKFGPGSRIIIISMRSSLVDKYIRALETSGRSVNDILVEKYELKQMNDNHAFQLFCKCALGGKPLEEEFSVWAWDISSAAGGLPFLIEAVGLSLYGQPIKFWEEAFSILSREPFSKKIRIILETRYDALEDDAKKIFLDIACFFMEKDMTISSYMWEACGYHPSTRIAELQDMSLVKTTDNNKLWMHNQVKFLGRKIVEEESPSKPSKRSRLWIQEDIQRVLNENKVAMVEALSATFDDGPHLFAEHRFFHNFSNLRYLEMNCAILKGHKQSANDVRGDLLPWLKWLEWQRCLNISILLALDLSRLVYLDLSGSTFRNWGCWKKIIKKARNLKVLLLKGCGWLAKSPVSHASVNLERLNLERCSKLPPHVVRSISKLRNLVSLNIKFCTFVQELPKDIGSLIALKELYIDGTAIGAINSPEGSYGKLEVLSACNCKSLSLSSSIGNLKSLLFLALDDTELSELPCTIGLLKNVRKLSLRSCKRLWKLPDSIGNLKELQLIDLSDTLVNEIPFSIEDLRNLKVLKMARTYIREFPRGIKNLRRLEEIDFSGCRSLMGDCDITGLSSLRILLLEDTEVSQVIGTYGQCSNFPNLRLDGRFCISKDGTTKGAQHWFSECETATQFQADRHHIGMQTMSQ